MELSEAVAVIKGKSKPQLFGTLGIVLLIFSILMICGIAFSLSRIIQAIGLKWMVTEKEVNGAKVEVEKYPPATKVIVQIAIGSWGATLVPSVARIVVWRRHLRQITSATGYKEERNQVVLVQNFILWLLGIVTTLALYMTTYFSGG